MSRTMTADTVRGAHLLTSPARREAAFRWTTHSRHGRDFEVTSDWPITCRVATGARRGRGERPCGRPRGRVAEPRSG
jgi:hypothetical protein